MPVEMSVDDFDACVDEALDSIPDELASRVVNCVVLVEDEPPADEPDLLGLYDGIPLTEREFGNPGMLPDRIFIYRGPLMRMCEDREELIDEIHITVVHEVAHFFGIEDDELHEWGYG